MKPGQTDTKVPRTLSEYCEWALRNLECDFNDPKSQRLYNTNVSHFYNVISEHEFFKRLPTEMERWEAAYTALTKSNLFMDKSGPSLLQKSYYSAVDKSFRENVLRNKDFPAPPKKGWVTTENLHAYFNDLIRCSVVCKFIDGPGFVTDRLMDFAKGLALERRRYSQERDEGYYAYHFYVRFPVKLVNRDWHETESNIEAEIQVTTQLQEVLRTLTHGFYASTRLLASEDSSYWKWDFSSNRFRVSYLSHALHLLESIILESRDQVADQGSPKPSRKD